MSYLVVSATLKEIAPLIKALQIPMPQDVKVGNLFGDSKLSFLIAGVGQMQTAHWLSRALTDTAFKGVINLGIAGSFSTRIPVGTVVRVSEEILADLGAENNEEFLDLFQLKLIADDTFPFTNGVLFNENTALITESIRSMTVCRSATVNRALSRAASIEEIERKYSPQIVNMEGAAVFYACLTQALPFQELRAISDMVGPRDKNQWDINGAVSALTEVAVAYLNELTSK